MNGVRRDPMNRWGEGMKRRLRAAGLVILAITDHPDGYGGDDLYVSRFVDGAWTAPVNLGPEINTPEYEYGPWVTSNGEFLLFTSHRDGPSNVYRAPMRLVHEAMER